MKKGELLYQGKAKSVYRTDDPDLFVMEFRNDASAFDGTKKASLERKGEVNNRFNAFIMKKLEAAGIPTHFVERLSATESLVKNLDMIPVECVVRNVSAGSLCRRLGVPEGQKLTPPTFEFFLKNDALHDPMVNEYHIRAFGWASEDEIAAMKKWTFQVNDILTKLFDDAGLILVDYKLEFGRFKGEVILGDEFTPDGCRLWDKVSGEKMDKDRFRQDLGDVIESYEEVARRLGVPLD
jgi:phosphoribosylaminoimidazole-succinocarboxamide synthase